jgi:hypothetical protein
MALTNCTINSASRTVDINQPLGNEPDVDLFITPDQGYLVSADDFANNTVADFRINSILLVNSTSAYAEDNKVKVIIDLKDAFEPSGDENIVIDIDGKAVKADEREYLISGTYNSVQSASTMSPAYTGRFESQGLEGSTALLFEKTFTANAGYYYESEPTISINSSNASAYTVAEVDYFDNTFSNHLIAKKFTISYEFPNYDITTGEVINFNARAIAIPASGLEIISFNQNKTPITNSGGIRSFKVYGTPGAKFNVVVTKISDSSTYDFTTGTFTSASTVLQDEEIQSIGYTNVSLVLPTTSSAEQYDVLITPGTGTTAANFPADIPTFTLGQISSLSELEVTATTTQALTVTYSENVINVIPGLTSADGLPLVDKNLQITITSALKDLYIRRNPSYSDFTNTDPLTNGGMVWDINPFLQGDGTGEIIISGSLRVFTSGSQDVSSVIDLDNLINQQAFAQSITTPVYVPHETPTDIQLSVSDNNNDDLTYSVVSNPSIGTVSIDSNGLATYIPNQGQDGSDSFTYKANDGFEDSNVATVNVSVDIAAP